MDHYRRPERAAHYRDKYQRSWLRRLSHRRERALLARALADLGVARQDVLDCPCGAGRMLGLAGAGVDRAPAMVREARANSDCRRLAAADAVALPFRDGAFDAVICHRLLHHLHDPAERIAVLGEAGRVARTAVVVSYWDAAARAKKSSRRSVLTRQKLAAEAAKAGLELRAPVRYVARRFSAFAITALSRSVR